MRLLAVLIALALSGVSATSIARAQTAPPPLVAGTSDLSIALPEIAAAFHRKTGQSVRLRFGLSRDITRQIMDGVPYELFLSSNETYVEQLLKARKTDGVGALYGLGRIGVFIPKTSRSLKPGSSLRDLAAAARDGRLTRVAMVDPQAGPPARAARDAMQHAGVWDELEPMLRLTETSAQSVQLMAGGGAQAAILPIAVARWPKVAALGTFTEIPPNTHAPLRQRVVLMKGAGEPAQAFYRFLKTPEARRIFRQYGMILPGGR